MINLYYGNSDRLDLKLSLISRLNNNCITLNDTHCDAEGLYKRFFIRDPFSNEKNISIVNYCCFEDIKIDNPDIINRFLNSPKILNIFIYINDYKISKKNKLIKNINEKNIFNLKPIKNSFGEIDNKELEILIGEIVSFVAVEGRIISRNVIESLLINTNFGGMIYDLDNYFSILEVYGENYSDCMLNISKPLNEYILMSITNSIQKMDFEKVYEFIYNDNIKYTSILDILQNMYFNLSKVFYAYKENNYQIDFSTFDFKIKTVNKGFVYRFIKYMYFLGPDRLNYIYNYINVMFKLECNSILPYSDLIKFQDLARVVSGKNSLILNNQSLLKNLY